MKAVCTQCQTAVPCVNIGSPYSKPNWRIIPHVVGGKEQGATCNGQGDDIQCLVAEHDFEKTKAKQENFGMSELTPEVCSIIDNLLQ